MIDLELVPTIELRVELLKRAADTVIITKNPGRNRHNHTIISCSGNYDAARILLELALTSLNRVEHERP